MEAFFANFEPGGCTTCPPAKPTAGALGAGRAPDCDEPAETDGEWARRAIAMSWLVESSSSGRGMGLTDFRSTAMSASTNTRTSALYG